METAGTAGQVEAGEATLSDDLFKPSDVSLQDPITTRKGPYKAALLHTGTLQQQQQPSQCVKEEQTRQADSNSAGSSSESPLPSGHSLTYRKWQHKYRQLKRYARELIYLNAAYCDEVVATEEDIAKALQQTRYLVSRLSYRQRVAELDLQTSVPANSSKHGPQSSKQHAHPPSKQHNKHLPVTNSTKQGVQHLKQLGTHVVKQSTSKHPTSVTTSKHSHKQTLSQSGKQSTVVSETSEKKAKKKAVTKSGKEQTTKVTTKKTKASASKLKKTVSPAKSQPVKDQPSAVDDNLSSLTIPLSDVLRFSGLQAQGVQIVQGDLSAPQPSLQGNIESVALGSESSSSVLGITAQGFPVDINLLNTLTANSNMLQKSPHPAEYLQVQTDNSAIQGQIEWLNQSQVPHPTDSTLVSPGHSDLMGMSVHSLGGSYIHADGLPPQNLATGETVTKIGVSDSSNGDADLSKASYIQTAGFLSQQDHQAEPTVLEMGQHALPVLNQTHISHNQVLEHTDHLVTTSVMSKTQLSEQTGGVYQFGTSAMSIIDLPQATDNTESQHVEQTLSGQEVYTSVKQYQGSDSLQLENRKAKRLKLEESEHLHDNT